MTRRLILMFVALLASLPMRAGELRADEPPTAVQPAAFVQQHGQASSGARPAAGRVSDPSEPTTLSDKAQTTNKSPATATTETETDGVAYSPQWPEPPDTGAMLLRLCLGTVVVLVLCVGSLWLSKPWLMKLQGTTANNSVMRVEGSVALGNRAILYLVKVGDVQLVAGTDASGLKSLIALSPSFKEVLDDQLPIEAPTAAVPPANLDRRLRAASDTQEAS